MSTQLIYTAKERYSSEDKIRKINENIEYIMKRLGGKVINSSYIILDGSATEAYGYYAFAGLGIITTSLTYSNHSGYNFCADFIGFEGKEEDYNIIKKYLENALKNTGLSRAERKWKNHY